jgi:branched-chain amino acid transport system ATP-binding protein
MLELDGVSRRYGGLRAVDDVSVTFAEGAITGIIGPNGAGKTTLFGLIAGTVAPSRGRIVFRGRDITGWRADRVCRAGIARTFQVVKPFWHLSVRDHLRAAAAFGGPPSPVGLRRGTAKGPTAAEIDRWLALTDLAGRADRPASTLTLAGCKRLEIARALASGASLLLLDETMAGLTPDETRAAVALVRRIRDEGRTVVLIEHVLAAVTDLCDRLLVLDRGRLVADGAPREVLTRDVVRTAYLGE